MPGLAGLIVLGPRVCGLAPVVPEGRDDGVLVADGHKEALLILHEETAAGLRFTACLLALPIEYVPVGRARGLRRRMLDEAVLVTVRPLSGSDNALRAPVELDLYLGSSTQRAGIGGLGSRDLPAHEVLIERKLVRKSIRQALRDVARLARILCPVLKRDRNLSVAAGADMRVGIEDVRLLTRTLGGAVETIRQTVHLGAEIRVGLFARMRARLDLDVVPAAALHAIVRVYDERVLSVMVVTDGHHGRVVDLFGSLVVILVTGADRSRAAVSR